MRGKKQNMNYLCTGNEIKADEVRVISEALMLNTALTQLDLSGEE